VTGNRPYDNPTSQAERRQVLKDTLHGRAVSDQGTVGGRYGAIGRMRVTGSELVDYPLARLGLTGGKPGCGSGWGRTPRPWNEYDRDDSDSLKQIASLRGLNRERKKRRAKLIRIIHARSQHLAARQPRLVVDNTE
jgi:hypothetical protein